MSENFLHLVFGGKVADPVDSDFTDQDNLDTVGIYTNYAMATCAWLGASHANVDDAYLKYVIVHLHRMLDSAQD